MRKLNLKFDLSAWCGRFISFIAFSFFLLGNGSPRFLYAAVTIKNLSFDAEAEKVVWKEENGRLKILAVGKLREGEVLPDTCRICVAEGEALVEKDGKETKVRRGEYFDPKEEMAKKDQAGYVKVAEGKVEYQWELEQNGKRKPLGDPVLVDKGEVLIKRNECYSFMKKSILEFDAGAEQSPQPPPGEEPGGEGGPPGPCASGPCES